MSDSDDKDICGYEGTTTNRPCHNPAGEDGRCWVPSHNGESVPDGGNPQGRPSKPAVDKEVIDAITSRIAEGKSDAEAFRQSNLHPSTKRNWLGKIDDPENVPRDPDFDTDPYGYFFRRYTHARGLGEGFYVENIMEMALEHDDVGTLISMLKQRYPESWGDVKRGEQTGGVVVQLGESEEFEIDPETLELVE